MTTPFRYEQAFSRNIGWVTREEQALLRSKRVAIAGGGGVGGVHALTLARLGVTKFRIADFDTFDVPNFNRQVGAIDGQGRVVCRAGNAPRLVSRRRLFVAAPGGSRGAG